MNKLLTIKQTVWKANPEILELKNGCKIISGKTELKIVIQNGKEALLVNMLALQLVENSGSIIYDEILGRDITLADVLLAIGRTGYTVDSYFGDFIYVQNGGMWEFAQGKKDIPRWNLLKTLDNQSQETLSFLYDLLSK